MMQQKGPLRLQPLSNDPDGATGSSLQAIKMQQRAREEDNKIRMRRLKGAIVLILQFLLDQGYTESLKLLQQESRVTLKQICPADNIDLLSIIAEYEQYFEFRFNRKPKLFRVLSGEQEGMVEAHGDESVAVRRRRYNSTPVTRAKRTPSNVGGNHVNYVNAVNPNNGAPKSNPPQASSSGLVRGLALAQKPSQPAASPEKQSAQDLERLCVNRALDPQSDLQECKSNKYHNSADDMFSFGRGLKPLPRFPSVELQELAMTIHREILDINPNIRWGAIAALDQAKKLLKEAVVMPVKYPELFAGIVRPWKGILLFGPPGTGKTLLAKAVATECHTTFFNISASSVVSKWRGDSEKLVRLLFELAVHYAPSTIFIDEIDSLMSSRSGDGMHEGSRRMKTELLIQMDGLSKREGGDVVFVLAASNVPWDLDTAMLRRLEKRILVGLPTHEARAAIFQKLLTQGCGNSCSAPALDWNACARLTEGMSGADIDVVCREATMRPIRVMIDKLERVGGPKEVVKGNWVRPCVTMEDVVASVACTQSSVRQSDLEKHEEWARKYGSGASS